MLDVLAFAVATAVASTGLDIAKDKFLGAVWEAKAESAPAQCERRLFVIEPGAVEWATLARFEGCAIAAVLGTDDGVVVRGIIDVAPGSEFARERIAKNYWRVASPPAGFKLSWTVASGVWPGAREAEITIEDMPWQRADDTAKVSEPSGETLPNAKKNKIRKDIIPSRAESSDDTSRSVAALTIAAALLGGAAAWVISAATGSARLPLRRARPRRTAGWWLAALAALATGAVGHVLDWEIDQVLEVAR